MKFLNKLENIVKRNNSLLCVGLDSDSQKLGRFANQFDFNKEIIDQTAALVCCYKPQIAFYSANGLDGLKDLIRTIEYLKEKYPHIPVLLDAKRGDVGHTSEMYAKEAFDVFDADAVTVNPYCGFDSLKPFFERGDRGVFVICRTSNPGAEDFQDLDVGDSKVYVEVAKKVVEWNKEFPNAYLQIGATWPGEIKVLRKLAPSMPFLIAGIGTQGGDLENTLVNGLREDRSGLIVNSSRGIIYAKDPQKAAKNLRDEINKWR